MTVQFPMGLAELSKWLRSVPIDQAYEELAFSYADVGVAGSEVAYRRFLGCLKWIARPPEEVVRRLFNQINSSFADAYMEVSVPMSVLVSEANSLMLYREGKHVGLRRGEIAFGYRKHLDVLDPRRRAKWIRGPSAVQVPSLMAKWFAIAERGDFDVDGALLMALLLIAIHPFADANGRMSRLVFTALLARSDRPRVWLNEAEDGELLRTGTGVESTEYLMAALVSSLAEGTNIIESDGSCDVSAIAPALERSLAAINEDASSLASQEEFRNYRLHLQRAGHLVQQSPRFACLRTWIV